MKDRRAKLIEQAATRRHQAHKRISFTITHSPQSHEDLELLDMQAAHVCIVEDAARRVALSRPAR